MANPVLTKAAFTPTCFRVPSSITPKQAKALKIYAKALQLAAIGGTDFTASLTSTLLSTAASALCGFEQSDRDASRILVEFNKATSAGATVPASISAKQAAINCLVEVTDKELDEADLYLTAALGRGKSYPQ